MSMILEQIQTEGIAELSYLIGDDKTGTAAVIDPRADVDVYVDLARKRKLSVAWDNAAMKIVELDQITVHELKAHAEEYQIVDVRSPEEWEEGHIPQAHRTPLRCIDTQKLAESAFRYPPLGTQMTFRIAEKREASVDARRLQCRSLRKRVYLLSGCLEKSFNKPQRATRVKNLPFSPPCRIKAVART